MNGPQSEAMRRPSHPEPSCACLRVLCVLCVLRVGVGDHGEGCEHVGGAVPPQTPLSNEQRYLTERVVNMLGGAVRLQGRASSSPFERPWATK